jgi:hypothetical protein
VRASSSDTPHSPLRVENPGPPLAHGTRGGKGSKQKVRQEEAEQTQGCHDLNWDATCRSLDTFRC